MISSPSGKSFPVSQSVSAPEVDGATSRQVVMYVWPAMRDYVMATILDMGAKPFSQPTPGILGQQVALP